MEERRQWPRCVKRQGCFFGSLVVYQGQLSSILAVMGGVLNHKMKRKVVNPIITVMVSVCPLRELLFKYH